MSHSRSICETLSDVQFQKNLRKLIIEKCVHSKLKSVNKSSSTSTKTAIRNVVERHPMLFIDNKSKGQSTEQIIEYYYNKLIHLICH